MDCTSFPEYTWWDFLCAVLGIFTFVFDVGSDLWVAQDFFSRGDLFWFGLLVSFMVLSSVVVQVFSWLWFTYDLELENYEEETTSKNILLAGKKHFKLYCWLHVFQLGIFFRRVSAIKQGYQVWWQGQQGSAYAVYMTHDLSMLRLFETFSESAPQLTLALYVMLRTERVHVVQYVSAAASASFVALAVVDYHRALRSFLPDKAQQGWGSSAVYFLWNLLLIAPRVAALALFASVLPACAPLHFLLQWGALSLWAWRQGTSFMDSAAGEWLYRATVGLVWYFSWFCVADGRTRARSAIYHAFMALDGGVLLAWWWAYRDPAETRPYAWGLAAGVPLCYAAGLLLKGLYYACFHPRLRCPADRPEDTPDWGEDAPDWGVDTPDLGEDTSEAAGAWRPMRRRLSAVLPYFVQGAPDLGVGTPNSGEDTPDLGEDMPDLGEDTPDSGEDTPDLGEDTPDLGEDTPDSGEDTPDSGEDTPDSGEDTPDWDVGTPDWDVDAPDWDVDAPDWDVRSGAANWRAKHRACAASAATPRPPRQNKRMAAHARNFYALEPSPRLPAP